MSTNQLRCERRRLALLALPCFACLALHLPNLCEAAAGPCPFACATRPFAMPFSALARGSFSMTHALGSHGRSRWRFMRRRQPMLSLPLPPLVSFKMKEGPFFRFLVSFKTVSVHLCTWQLNFLSFGHACLLHAGMSGAYVHSFARDRRRDQLKQQRELQGCNQIECVPCFRL